MTLDHDYNTVPTSAPMLAVRAIASAPQKVTRIDARRTFAPPALAPTAPSKAKNSNDAIDTIGDNSDTGETTARSNGNAAPIAKVMADAIAV